MAKHLLTFVLAITSLCFSFDAIAAKTFQYYGDNSIVPSGALQPQTCDAIKSRMAPDNAKNATCSGLDAALKTKDYAVFTMDVPSVGRQITIGILVGGSCTAGVEAGKYSIPVAYTKQGSVDQVLQQIHDPTQARGAANGCEIVYKELGECFWHEAVNGVQLKDCDVYMKESGQDGGESAAPDSSNGGYTGGGTGPGGTDPGGGTNPGGGGTNPGGGGTNPGGGGTNPGGGTGGGGTDPGTGSGTGFCQQNPGLNICHNSAVSVSCGDIQCSGDAIQCYTMRIAAERQCESNADRKALENSEAGKLGKGVLDGLDPDADKLPAPGKGAVVSIPELDQSGWLGGGECFPDTTLTVQGRQLVIPFSKACGALIVLRYAIMIVAALASFKMLSGAILRE